MAQPDDEPELRKAVRYAELLFGSGVEMRKAIVRAAATYKVPARTLVAAIEIVREDGER